MLGDFEFLRILNVKGTTGGEFRVYRASKTVL